METAHELESVCVTGERRRKGVRQAGKVGLLVSEWDVSFLY